MPKTIKTNAIYSAAEVARLFGCTVETVYHKLRAGQIHGRKFGRKSFVTGAELARYLDERQKVRRQIAKNTPIPPEPATREGEVEA